MFNGHDYVSIPSSSALQLTTGMTLAAWVKPVTSGRGQRGVINKQRAYGLFSSDDHGHAFARVRMRRTPGTARVRVGRWSYLVATYDGTTLRLYIDGHVVGVRVTTSAMARSDAPLRIGEQFKGAIDDVQMWSRALSATELRAAALR